MIIKKKITMKENLYLDIAYLTKLSVFFRSSTKGSTVSSSLETEFVSWPMVRYKREVLFGWVDLLGK